jgi:hypothetical protein
MHEGRRYLDLGGLEKGLTAARQRQAAVPRREERLEADQITEVGDVAHQQEVQPAFVHSLLHPALAGAVLVEREGELLRHPDLLEYVDEVWFVCGSHGSPLVVIRWSIVYRGPSIPLSRFLGGSGAIRCVASGSRQG